MKYQMLHIEWMKDYKISNKIMKNYRNNQIGLHQIKRNMKKIMKFWKSKINMLKDKILNSKVKLNKTLNKSRTLYNRMNKMKSYSNNKINK